MEEGKEVIDGVEEDPLRDAALIGGGNKVEHYDIASYGTLIALAKQLGYGAGSWATSGRGDGTYAYVVAACNAGGCGPNSAAATVSVNNVPPTPTNVHAIDSFSGKREILTITWNATPGATYYQVLRNNTTTMWQVNAPTTLQLVESGPIGEIILYGYQVRACNAVGCSAWVDAL